MPLDPEDHQRITGHLKKHLKVCPVCHSSVFNLSGYVATPVLEPSMEPGKQGVIGAQFAPLVMVYCDNCYYAMPFAAVQLRGKPL